MQKQIRIVLSNVAKPPKSMGFDFLPEPSIFVPYPQHQTVIENSEHFAHF